MKSGAFNRNWLPCVVNSNPTKSPCPALLERLSAQGRLAGRIWTMDALHTHGDNAKTLVKGGSDYVMPVKGNQETLHQDIHLLFERAWGLSPEAREAMSVHKEWDAGHGRIEWRRITASDALNDYLEWPGVGQVFRVERRRYLPKTGESQPEVVYGITSLSPDRAGAERLSGLVRGHWSRRIGCIGYAM